MPTSPEDVAAAAPSGVAVFNAAFVAFSLSILETSHIIIVIDWNNVYKQ